MKIIFLGTSDFAVPAFEKLIKNGYEVSGILTGQGPIKTLAEEYNLKIYNLEDLTDLEFDMAVVAAYGKIIPEKYLRIPKHGFLNIHPSLLPKYRGPSPIQAALLNGDKETAVSIMQVDKEMDHGPVLSHKTYDIWPNTTYKKLEKELAELGADLLIETIPKYINGEIKGREQDHSQATFTKILNREDGKIDWHQSAEKIFNQIRALNPEPGTWTMWQGKILNIKEAEIEVKESTNPGTVTKLDEKIAVTTGEGYLILKTVQLEGKKTVDVNNFLNGYPNLLNSKLD